jgi:hypothetical protein
MTFAFQTSDNAGAVSAFFERAQDVNNINLPGAGHTHNFDVRRILQSHRTCQVRGGVASVIAAECNNDRIKIFAHS